MLDFLRKALYINYLFNSRDKYHTKENVTPLKLRFYQQDRDTTLSKQLSHEGPSNVLNLDFFVIPKS